MEIEYEWGDTLHNLAKENLQLLLESLYNEQETHNIKFYMPKIIPLGNVPDSVKLIDIIDTNDRNIKFYWSPMELFYLTNSYVWEISDKKLNKYKTITNSKKIALEARPNNLKKKHLGKRKRENPPSPTNKNVTSENEDPQFKIIIQQVLSEKIDLEIFEEEFSIYEIKKLIFKEKQINVDEQRIFHQNIELGDNTKLSSLHKEENQIKFNLIVRKRKTENEKIPVGYNEDTDEIEFKELYVNDKKIIFHPGWEIGQFKKYISRLSGTEEENENYLKMKFEKIAKKLYNLRLDIEEQELLQMKAELDRSKERLRKIASDFNLSFSYFQNENTDGDKIGKDDFAISEELENKLKQVVAREVELRKSEKMQKLYEDAEGKDTTDWLEVTMKMRNDLLLEFGITGPDRFSLLEHAARKYGAFYVTNNLAKSCNYKPDQSFPVSDVFVYSLSLKSDIPLATFFSNASKSTKKKYHLLISGSIS